MIRKFSTMTPEQKDAYMQYYEKSLLTGAVGFKVEIPFENFDARGLRFDIEYLERLSYNVIFLPLELMAEYVDVVTKTRIDEGNEAYIFHQIIDMDFDVEKLFPKINATAIGNLAYIVLMCKNEKARQCAEQWLNQIFVKAKGALLNYINEELV